MDDSYSSDENIRRLEIARDLFSDLLLYNPDYPSDVKAELKKDLGTCEDKLKNLTSSATHGSITSKRGIGSPEIDISHFVTDFQIEFYNGTEGRKGTLLIDKNHSVGLSGIENDIFQKLYNALKKSWDTSSPREIGWVSNDELRISVSKWRKKLAQDSKFEVIDTRITTVINRMNNGIKEVVGVGLIENGHSFGMDKHHRLRVNTGHINLPD